MRIFLFVSLFVLAACQESPQTHNLGAQNKSETQGIVGGVEVASTDRLARLVFSLISTYPDNSKTIPTGEMTELTDLGYQCTAVAIGPRLALTAAHCLEDVNLKHRLEITDKNGNKIINLVKKFSVHPDFKTDERADIAVLLLQNDLPLATVYPEVPTKDEYLNLEGLIAAGYGRITGEKLREGGSGILRTAVMDAKSYSPEEPTFTIDQTNKKGICSGDSGGPSFIENNTGLILVGIASKVTFYNFPGDENPDTCNFKGTYVNVQYYLDWMAGSAEELLNSK